MSKIKFERNVPLLAALVPTYGEQGGNVTRIYTRHGKVYVDKRKLLTLLKKTVKYFGADLPALRALYGKHLGCTQSVPLPLSPKLILVPIKMRLPEFESDGATGYVNVTCVENLIELPEPKALNKPRCEIHLTGGNFVYSYFSYKKTDERIKKGYMALSHFKTLQTGGTDSGSEPGQVIAGPNALNTLAAISKFFYELLTTR